MAMSKGYQTTCPRFKEAAPASPLQPWGNDCPMPSRPLCLPRYFLEALVELLGSGGSAKAPGTLHKNTLTQYLQGPLPVFPHNALHVACPEQSCPVGLDLGPSVSFLR